MLAEKSLEIEIASYCLSILNSGKQASWHPNSISFLQSIQLQHQFLFQRKQPLRCSVLANFCGHFEKISAAFSQKKA